MINEIIGIFLPSIVALKMHEHLEGNEENIIKRVERYLIYVMLINCISYIIVVYGFNHLEIVFTPMFTIKYILMSLITAIILPIVQNLFPKNINIHIKVEKNEKNN